MNAITETQYSNLIDKIYTNLMEISYMDENGELWEKGMGERGETRDEAKRIVKEWLTENSITIL
jgi:hypothetical protein